VFCRDSGAVIAREAEICPECGIRRRDQPRSGIDATDEQFTAGGSPFVAAVRSGLG